MSDSNRAFVAGGTGTAGRAYSRGFVTAGYEVVATARDDDGARALVDLGAEPLALDLTDAEAVAAAIQEAAITRNVIDAAARAGAGRLIYTSVHGADRRTGVPHFDVKGRLEQDLGAAAVPATVIRPCTFMEALSAPWIRDGVVSRGVLASPIAIDAPIAYVAATDVAEVGVRALADPEFAGATIELGGPRAVTYGDLLPMLSELLGRTIRYENVPLDVVESQVGSDVAAMVRLFNREGFAAEPDPAVGKLAVELTSVKDFLRAQYAPANATAAERG